ncbi:addiction module toxin RelE [Sphingomonas sp. Leaf357]|uniref:type II toxin-antitoxin system RelE family toxin n=1 Tax=Sphingomonas sp. Leaf357 TaxID=1736350 RepID=UPI0006FBB946|nr:type II toxin-antitoxin system RelE/ParE family toxin [Sphingomonas sp. Leaf357]KQS04251.1 addiction module toxin RelE [Sphingomonas sp. Leaf357]
MKNYELEFLASALKEWKKLAPNIRDQFAARLKERLNDPHVQSARLSGMPDCYKIKLRAAGYRLVYRVEDDVLIVVVVAVGKRDRNAVYKIAAGRL